MKAIIPLCAMIALLVLSCSKSDMTLPLDGKMTLPLKGKMALSQECKNKEPSLVMDEDGNQVKDGKEWRCHPNGAPKLIRSWKNGKEHGKWTYWHKDGYRVSETEYNNGKEHGKWTTWHYNGQKKYEGEYENGKELDERACWDITGKQIACKW